MKIAVSACLLGVACRYDGRSKPCAEMLALRESHRLILVCPEVAGGLRVPHPANEIVACDGPLRVVDTEGADNTDIFLAGAQKTLDRVQARGCKLAIMKAKSPSCGNGRIYDGTFSGTLVQGYGVAARLLRAHGIRVLDETQLQACLARSAALRSDKTTPLLAISSKECPVLFTEHFILRPLAADDAAGVFACCSDPRAVSNGEWKPQHRIEDAQAFIEKTASAPHIFGVFKRSASGKDAAFTGLKGPACTGLEDAACVGLEKAAACVGLLGLIRDCRRYNVDALALGYVFANREGNGGFSVEASLVETIREIARYGFEELGLKLISCACYADSAPSRAALEKCGFAYEGMLSDARPDSRGLLQASALYSRAGIHADALSASILK